MYLGFTIITADGRLWYLGLGLLVAIGLASEILC
jgi:hypothetical protein